MATILYGKNDDGGVFEVKIDAKRVHAYLGLGYVCDTAEFDEQKEDEEILAVGAADVGMVLDEEDLRAEAKSKGIRNWHNMTIDNLKGKLGYVD